MDVTAWSEASGVRWVQGMSCTDLSLLIIQDMSELRESARAVALCFLSVSSGNQSAIANRTETRLVVAAGSVWSEAVADMSVWGIRSTSS